VLESIPIKTVRFVPLVRVGDIIDVGSHSIVTTTTTTDAIDWNDRYKSGWAYGKEPNEFLVYCVNNYCHHLHDDLSDNHHHDLPYDSHHLSHPNPNHHDCRGDCHSSLRALSLGEGQGRNAVYLATKGYDCVAVDSSIIALSKAKKLAQARGVDHYITCIQEDLCIYEPTPNQYDLIISIFCILKPADRAALHKRCIQALRPGGCSSSTLSIHLYQSIILYHRYHHQYHHCASSPISSLTRRITHHTMLLDWARSASNH